MLLLLNGMQAHMAMHAKSILSTWGAHGCYKRRDKAHYQSYKLYLTQLACLTRYDTSFPCNGIDIVIPLYFCKYITKKLQKPTNANSPFKKQSNENHVVDTQDKNIIVRVIVIWMSSYNT